MSAFRPLPLVLIAALAASAAGADLPPVVYVPFDKTPNADPKGQGVMLPYERFVKLWDAANPTPPDKTPGKPPVPAALAGYTLAGAVRGELVELTLDATVNALADGWSSVALPSELALTEFKPADARLVLERGAKSLALHLPTPGAWRFAAGVAAPVTRDAAGRRTAVITLPAGGAGRVDLLLPDADAEVVLDPPVAATTVAEKGGTRVMAVVGAAPRLSVSWQPPARAIAGEALVLVEQRLRLGVGERSLRYDLDATLTVLRRPLAELTIALPPGVQVLAVEAKDLRTWERTGDTLTLRLHRPVEGACGVSLRLEQSLPALAAGASTTIDVAWPAVPGAARTGGTLALSAGDGVTAALAIGEGLAQIDPAALGPQPEVIAAWRVLASPAPAKLTVTHLQAELRAGVHQLVRLGTDEDRIDVVLELDVRRAGLFTLNAQVPAGWELVDTAGAAVDDARLATPVGELRRLDVALRNRLLGSGELVLRFRAPPSIPRDGKPAATAIGLLRLGEAKRVRGTLAVSAPKSWSLASSERTGLGGAEAEAVRREGPLSRFARTLGEDEDLPLAFTVLAADAGLRLAAAPRTQELAVRIEELVTVADGALRRLATLRGDVRYRALDALRIEAPTALDAVLVFKGPVLAQHSVLSRKDGRSTWELRFRTPLTGGFSITAESTQELPRLTPGVAAPLSVEPLRPLDTTRLTVVSSVAREGTVEITAKADGADALAAADLPAGLQGQGVVAGFQGTAPATLALMLVRHDLLPLADAAVVSAGYEAMASDDGLLRVRGDLLLATRGRPWLALTLPPGAELLEAAVDGRQARPSRRTDGSVVIPLGATATAASQRIAFVYELRLPERLGSFGRMAVILPNLSGGTGHADPSITVKPAGDEGRPLPVGQVELGLWLPDGLAPVGWSGDLHRAAGPDSFTHLLRQRLVEVATLIGGARQADVDELDNDGLTVRLTPSGRRHELHRLGDGGQVTVAYAGRGLLQTLAVAAFAAGLALAWFLRRRVEIPAVLTLAGGLLALVVSGPWLAPIAAFTFGTGAITVLLAANAGVHALRSWRRKDTGITPDPWLERPAGGTEPKP